MEPALPIDDSEDEACVYLKFVQVQSLNFKSRAVKGGESEPSDRLHVPQSSVPSYNLPLSSAQQKSIIQKFLNLRAHVGRLMTPAEIRRKRPEIHQMVYSEQPLIDKIKEFDQLTVKKLLSYLESQKQDFEKFEIWIYSMLVILEHPLDLDIYSVLNSLMIRAIELSPKPEALIIILIISDCFGQKLA